LFGRRNHNYGGNTIKYHFTPIDVDLLDDGEYTHSPCDDEHDCPRAHVNVFTDEQLADHDSALLDAAIYPPTPPAQRLASHR
jgi:hypothetical protein